MSADRATGGDIDADSGPYRRLIAAMSFFAVVHVLALVTMGAILMHGIGPADTNSLARARFIADNPWLWRLGWLPWQLCALSNVLLCLAFIGWTRRRGGHALAWLALALCLLAVVFEQWAEWRMITEQVHVAKDVLAGQLSIAAHADLEQKLLLLTGTCANTGYIAMTGVWMLIVRVAGRQKLAQSDPDAANEASRLGPGGWPGWMALGLLGLFTGAGLTNWQGQIPGSAAADWYQVATTFNGLAFPALVVWCVYFTGRLGQVERAQRGVTDGAPLVWPQELGWRWLAPLAAWDGVRDLMRATFSRLPFLRMVSNVRDVVYLSWLVPVERVRHLVDERLELDVRDGLTAVSVLTYRHGHFGLRLLGPARRLLPSPVQSNWRLYLQAPADADSSEGIAFFMNGLDNAIYTVGARLLADGLPVHVLASAEHERRSERVHTALDPGTGSGPSLQTVVREDEAGRALPAAFAERFESWDAAVDYLVRQDRAERIHGAIGLRSVSEIRIPIDPAEARPAIVESLESATLGSIIDGCDALAFVVPQVDFAALGERWHRL